MALDTNSLQLVFSARPDLVERIKTQADTPERVTLFNDVAAYLATLIGDGDSQDAKRRKVPTVNGAGGSGTWDMSEPVYLVVGDISLSVPVRKKLALCFSAGGVYARVAGSTEVVPGTAFAWRDIEHIFVLPVPEKNQTQYNYVLLPKGSSFIPKAGVTGPDPLVFTVNDVKPKPETISGPQASLYTDSGPDYKALFNRAFTTALRNAKNPVSLVSTNPGQFASAVKQSHKPNEPAVHVKAFRGSKEGFIFFLPTGILWGFKKPLLFIPLAKISAVSYTSVLQRTFNMVVDVFCTEGNFEETEEVEFSMIDQQDYQVIDEKYVKKHELADRSMADARKAKLQLAENIKAAKDKEAGGADEADEAEPMDVEEEVPAGDLEWEKEQKLQDAEDAEEEDYMPESDDNSDGSGSSSEESDGEGGSGGEDDDDDDDEEEEQEGGEDEDEEDEAGSGSGEDVAEVAKTTTTPATRVGGWATLNR